MQIRIKFVGFGLSLLTVLKNLHRLTLKSADNNTFFLYFCILFDIKCDQESTNMN